MKQNKGVKAIKILIFIVLFCVFAVSAFLFGSAWYGLHKEETQFTELQDLMPVHYAPESSDTAASASAGNVSQSDTSDTQTDDNAKAQHYNAVTFEKLQAINPDCIAWINIPGTVLNYPVMRSREDDPQFYLHRDYWGNYSYSGVPFMGQYCDTDSFNMIIYGHNMNNGSMFASIIKYQNPGYFQQHPYIYFDTATESVTFKVIAAFREQIYEKETTGVFKYYNYGGRIGQPYFEDYVDQVTKAALYDTGAAADNEEGKIAVYGDQLLTLSTCARHAKDGRFVVVAKRITSTEKVEEAPEVLIEGEEGTGTDSENASENNTSEANASEAGGTYFAQPDARIIEDRVVVNVADPNAPEVEEEEELAEETADTAEEAEAAEAEAEAANADAGASQEAAQ